MSSHWREEEKRVEGAAERVFPDDRYRVADQMRTQHQGNDVRMDVHVAERRQGGQAVVIDAKDFNGPLPRHEVDTTAQYQRDSRASGGIIVTGPHTTVTPALREYAADHNVQIVPDNRNLGSNLQKAYAAATVQPYVRGSTRSDGTYVAPYVRHH